MRAHRVFASMAPALVAIALGCGSAPTADDGDAATDADAARDTLPPPPDARHDVADASVEAGAYCDYDALGETPILSELVAEGRYFLFDDDTITTDDFIVVWNADTSTVQAISLIVGEPPIGVVKGTADALVVVNGAVVFVLTNVDTAKNVATLGVWTHAGGYHELSKSAVATEASVAASLDGSTIAFTDGTTGSSTNVWVADATGASTKMIFPSAMNDSTCAPYLEGTATGIALAACKPSVSGFPTATLAVYDVSGSAKTLALGVQAQFSVDQSGSRIFVDDVGGTARVVAADGSSDDTIASDVLQGTITPEGTRVVWISLGASGSSGPLYSADVSPTPTATKIADAAAEYQYPLALGSKFAVYATTLDATNFHSDLHYAFVDGSAAPITVSSDPQSAIHGDTVTIDQTTALFFTNLSGGAGDLDVLDLTTPDAKPTLVAPTVWLVRSRAGSQIVYNDNWAGGGSGNEGIADIRLLDVHTGARDYVALQAENNFYLTRDRAKIVFATSDPSFTKPGLYLYTFPCSSPR